MIPAYDDNDLTLEEIMALAAGAFDNADNGGAIPVEPVEVSDDREEIALRHSSEFNEGLRRSQERLEGEGAISTDEVRRRLGL